jgi:hypothetical protein
MTRVLGARSGGCCGIFGTNRDSPACFFIGRALHQSVPKYLQHHGAHRRYRLAVPVGAPFVAKRLPGGCHSWEQGGIELAASSASSVANPPTMIMVQLG